MWVLTKMFLVLSKLQVRLEMLLLILAVVILVTMLLLVMADILARNLLNRPIRGVAEFLSQTLYLLVFLGLTRAFREGALIHSDLIFRYAPGKRWRKGFELGHLTITLAVSMLVTALTFQSLSASFVAEQWIGLPGYFSFPEWPLRLLTFLGALMLTNQVALSWMMTVKRTEIKA